MLVSGFWQRPVRVTLLLHCLLTAPPECGPRYQASLCIEPWSAPFGMASVEPLTSADLVCFLCKVAMYSRTQGVVSSLGISCSRAGWVKPAGSNN